MATAYKDSFGTTGLPGRSAAAAVSLMAVPVIASMDGRRSRPAYRLSFDEDFMSPAHLAYFREKLTAWREEVVRESRLTLSQLQSEPLLQPDATDRASSETDWGLELRTRDRQRKLIAKINAGLRRIDTGEYGYCEVTGEPIALARLEARPIATMTVEAQSRHERHEKVSRDD